MSITHIHWIHGCHLLLFCDGRATAAQRRGIKYSPEERGGIRPSSQGRGFFAKWFGDSSVSRTHPNDSFGLSLPKRVTLFFPVAADTDVATDDHDRSRWLGTDVVDGRPSGQVPASVRSNARFKWASNSFSIV